LSSSASNVPVPRRKTFVIHGHGGILCRQPDALHPGKRENPPEEKVHFLSWRVPDCQKTLGMRRRAAALRLKSAAGDMCGGEERKYSASYINLRPQK